MSDITDKIQNLMAQVTPYTPDDDPPVIVYFQDKQYKTTANGYTKSKEIYETLEQVLKYIKRLEEDNKTLLEDIFVLENMVHEDDLMGL